MPVWDDLTKMFKKGVSVVAKKTDEYTRIGKIKVDIIGIKRDIERQNLELGKKVYQLLVEENDNKIASNTDIKDIIEKATEFNNKLKEKYDELEAVKEEFAEKTGEAYLDEEPVDEDSDAKKTETDN
ncbi:hypothetical protein JXB12_06510 [candidate division KSB1 bacterium]|nr:hypothetical protein [candidate division KSB1 bacterium]